MAERVGLVSVLDKALPVFFNGVISAECTMFLHCQNHRKRRQSSPKHVSTRISALPRMIISLLRFFLIVPETTTRRLHWFHKCAIIHSEHLGIWENICNAMLFLNCYQKLSLAYILTHWVGSSKYHT